MLAARGFAVFVLRYFERTGTAWADDRTIRQNFQTWMKTISDAITFASVQPGVDPTRVALLGFSLGAYLALSVATADPRVKAVVDCFGGLPEELTHDRKPLPPVLILHGEADPVVPVSEAYKLQHLFEDTGTPYETKLYRGAGHGFSGFDLLDAGQRTLAFLEKHLQSRESI
jgi:carboxymethylenebutenolidase